jgi:GDPmannose 4,6-dehydratase
MWLILQQERPDDYVIATGITTAIREFVRMSFAEIGIEIAFAGSGADEQGKMVSVDEVQFIQTVGEASYLEAIKDRIRQGDNTVVLVDPQYFRPTEVELLIGDSSKAQKQLGWQPQYDLKALVEDMMKSDLKLFRKDACLKENGYNTLNYFES